MGKKILLALSLSLLLISCGQKIDEKVPPGVLSEEKMTEILVQKHVQEAAYNLNKTNEQLLNFAESHRMSTVLAAMNVSREDFETSLKYFAEHPQKLNRIYDEVINELNRMQAKSAAKR